jgi:hypothetical protein
MKLMAVLVGSLLALAGCGVAGLGGEDADTKMRHQARDILDRWEAAYATAKKPVFAPTGRLAPQLVGENPTYYEKSIWYGQDIVLDVQAPEPGPAELRWPDGSSRPVVALGAAAVVAAMAEKSVKSVAGGCKGCEGTVHVTGARFTTVSLDAVDGPVTAPAWELTLAGLPVRALAPAVADADALVVPETSWDPYNTPAGLPMEKVVSTSDGRTLTISFTGARDGSDKPCGADYWAEAVFSAHAMVLMLHTRAHTGGGPCNDIGYARQVTLELQQSFIGLMVLEGQVGHPVVVTRQ